MADGLAADNFDVSVTKSSQIDFNKTSESENRISVTIYKNANKKHRKNVTDIQ